MTIKDVCKQFGITADTLRYYERVGVIPKVSRNKNGRRDYAAEDMEWVRNAVCMRNAGLPVETLAEYVRLFQEGDETIQARRDLLAEARKEIRMQLERTAETLKLLDYKVSMYDEAIRTGNLSWDKLESIANE
jgi:DNA-binding transcriptional MerR regulator